MKIYFIIVLSILVVACSNKAVYDNIQLSNRQHCQKLPPSQYEDCIKQAQKTYDEYQKERKEALGK